MALATIDDDVYVELQEYIGKYPLDYPTVKFFLDKVVRRELEKLKKKEVMENEKE